MVKKMNNDQYFKLVNKYNPPKKKFRNQFYAFLCGGFLGFFSELVAYFLENSFALSKEEACSYVCLIMIFAASLFTSLGFFDTLVVKYKSGLIIPTTGFAHSLTSSAMDYKRDGLILGVGANTFKLAGSVLLYGILGSFFIGILGVIIHG